MKGKMPSRLRIVSVSLAALLAGVVVFWALRREDPEWLREASDPQWRFPAHTPKTMTDESAAVGRRIQNDLMLRPLWGKAEIDEIERLLVKGYPRSLHDQSPENRETREEFSARNNYTSAFLALWNRLDNDAPMTPEARQRGIELVLNELSAEFPERRRNGGLALIDTKLIEDPAIRAEVDRLLKDEDANTAEVIALQLTEYDRRRAIRLRRQAEPKR
jgi:hypothetical protein